MEWGIRYSKICNFSNWWTVIARPTITIYNAYHLPETLEWLDKKQIKINPTHLTYPEHLSLTVLPKS